MRKNKTAHENVIAFLTQKKVQEWVNKNPSLIEDIQKLVSEMIMFEVKYGIKVNYNFENTPIKKGRFAGEKKFISILKDIND